MTAPLAPVGPAEGDEDAAAAVGQEDGGGCIDTAPLVANRGFAASSSVPAELEPRLATPPAVPGASPPATGEDSGDAASFGQAKLRVNLFWSTDKGRQHLEAVQHNTAGESLQLVGLREDPPRVRLECARALHTSLAVRIRRCLGGRASCVLAHGGCLSVCRRSRHSTCDPGINPVGRSFRRAAS